MSGTTSDIVLIGASGFLGLALAERLKARGVILTHCTRPVDCGSQRFSLLEDDPGKLLSLLSPRIVFLTFRVEDFHREQEVQDAFRTLVEACKSARVVLASTDAVLEGSCGNYSEPADPRPVTGYGRRYLEFERTLRQVCPNSCAVRFSYIFGFSAGKLDRRLAKTRRLLREGKTIPLFDDMYKSPLEVNQAAAVLEAVAGLDYKGILHAGGGRMSVYQFQKLAMHALGERSEGLMPTRMPPDQDLQRDTSLNSSLLKSLTGFAPSSVADVLKAPCLQ